MRAVGFVSGLTQYGVIPFMCPSAYVNVRIVSASSLAATGSSCLPPVRLLLGGGHTHSSSIHLINRLNSMAWTPIQPSYKGLRRLKTTIVHLYLCSSVLFIFHFPSVCTYIHLFVYLDPRLPLFSASLMSFCHGKLFTTRQTLEDARPREINVIRAKSGT